MKPTEQLKDELYRERVLRAKRMPPEEKLLAGGRLFDHACRITTEGIRNQHPHASEERVGEILAERLALRRRLEGRE